jgi:hypothetical protein
MAGERKCPCCGWRTVSYQQTFCLSCRDTAIRVEREIKRRKEIKRENAIAVS